VRSFKWRKGVWLRQGGSGGRWETFEIGSGEKIRGPRVFEAGFGGGKCAAEEDLKALAKGVAVGDKMPSQSKGNEGKRLRQSRAQTQRNSWPRGRGR
jgi:hypothetical protein